MATTNPTGDLRLRALGVDDIDAGERLSVEAGWNQTGADWHHILSNGIGWGYEDDTGHLGATAMVLPYDDRIAWICMVLVTDAWRKRGLATALLRHCISESEQRGWAVGLDATDAGRQVYLPLGFTDQFSLTRYVAAPPITPERPVESLCRPMNGADMAAVVALDCAANGTARAELLQSLAIRTPHLAWVADQGGTVCGFCLGRDGRDADQIGPLAADTPDIARSLLHHALLARLDGKTPVYIDAVDSQGTFVDELALLGFEKQRGFSRMLKGRATPLADPAPLFAIAGPELS